MSAELPMTAKPSRSLISRISLLVDPCPTVVGQNPLSDARPIDLMPAAPPPSS